MSDVRSSMWPAMASLAVALMAPGSAAAQPATAATQVAGRPIQTGLSFELESAVMGDVRELNIWVPPGYETSEERYTILYLLDGALDQDFHHIAGLAQLASLSWTFGPLIVVGVQTRQRQAELTPVATDPRYLSAFPDSGGADRFRRFLREEVIPFVEGRYRVGARRALMGESLAGLFVVDTLLSEPELFHDYVAISPSLWWDDRRPMREAASRADPLDTTDRRLYLAVANEGGTMQDGVDLLRSALARLPRDKLALNYSDKSGGFTHSTVYHSAAEEALRWLYPAPPYEAGPTPWFMIEGASPPQAESSSE
ncbi:alpha/beta hydrolase [Sphingosinicella sp. CPCC 101087]|uniref:alpha/beta hydrolase n=1 Tax=Sphingosinicella sp. CPCC 101087 TaxID=2497754 RepID=UPI00101B7620|nr:alpha/beta hydrolase-fold protein [Sphingosinicella sp. CPCC 101087]